MISPRIILVRPQMGENIGAAARVMANFGMDQLTVVAPRDRWPNRQASALAASAGFVLEQARRVKTLAEALEDCDLAFALTARERDLTKPSFALPQLTTGLAQFTYSETTRCAFVFGQENNGLDNDAIALCQAIIHVETSPRCSSINLAQAVGLVCYEWHRAHVAPKPAAATAEIAPLGMVHQATEHLISLLETRGYFRSPETAAGLQNTIHTLFTNHQWTEQQIRTWRGILRYLGKE
jgi:tRNA/rRNA methyltransferase